MSNKTLQQLYAEHTGKVSDKWALYLSEYDRLFGNYRNKPVRMLEIGIQNGGSLEVWSKYFSNATALVGCDINPDCARLTYDEPRIGVIVGNANSRETSEQVFQRCSQFDIIIDDGSHKSSDIVQSFALYFPRLVEGGLFVVEDLHCSYWSQCEGGLFDPYSSITFFKRLVDVVNHEHWGIPMARADILAGIFGKYGSTIDDGVLSQVHSVEFFNSMCVVRKASAADNGLGQRVIVGLVEMVAPRHRGSMNQPDPLLDQTGNYWTARTTPPDEALPHLEKQLAEGEIQIESLTQTVAERDGQIAYLKQAVAELVDKLKKLNQSLEAILDSRSWGVTRPLRWFYLQMHLVREHGLSDRIKAFVRKIVRGVAKAGINFIQARPALRIRLHGWALRLGLREPLLNLYKIMQAKTTFGVPNLRELVVSSYPAWSKYFDTPSTAVLDRMAATADSRHPVFIVARFEKISERYASELALRLIASVGQPWTAVFLFSPDCNSPETIENIRLSANHDARICFDQHSCRLQTDLTIFIEGGAFPRPHALRVFADALLNSPEALVAYSDEDRHFDGMTPSDPWFKPQFSPLLAKQGVLLGRMLGFRDAGNNSPRVQEKLCSDFVNVTEFPRNYTIAAGEQRVLHIPHVLFHDAFEPRSPIVVVWNLPEVLPTVSIIIPTKDRWDLLGPCLESIWLSDWPRELLDVVVVDNDSTEPQTLKMLGQLAAEGKIRVIRDPRPFNWSRLNNLAAKESVGELLVFLNNDTEVDDPAWLKKLSAQALRPEVGAVGCKLLYPDRTVQHGGVIAGIQGVAGHAHLFLQENEGGYRNLANITHEVSAVTGACLAVSRRNFGLAGGFNEDFRVAFNDVVFCFTLHALGLRNVYVADPLLIHYESKSRGFDDTPEKQALNREETQKTWAIHAPLMRNDPFYSPNLSLWKPYELSFAPRRRAIWDDPMNRPLRVMMLSVTHAIGHGVPVVLAMQAAALVKQGYEVIVAGPRSDNDFPYPGCVRIEVCDPIEAAVLAAELSVDLVIAQTPPFFSITRWTGEYPRVICYDHGEPPSEWFQDSMQRRAALAEKDISLMMATAVFAISDAIAAESRTPVHGVIPEGNTHLGQWCEEANIRRNKVRKEREWHDRFVVLNVCRFHSGERIYKGVDTYADVRDALQISRPEMFDKTVFVLCGKGTEEDVAAMAERGLSVHANVTNDEMFDLYCAADAYANFSKWEGYNLGIAQALAMGLPTIASDIPAHRAFGIDVTDSAEEAAEWLFLKASQNTIRMPKVWSWDKPLSQLINVIESVCADAGHSDRRIRQCAPGE